MSASRFDRPAYEVQYAESTFPCLLACEHASNYIPADYQGLGLSRSSLEEHIAWDIGAHELLGKLAGDTAHDFSNVLATIRTHAHLLAIDDGVLAVGRSQYVT